jgi:hypothetical protein
MLDEERYQEVKRHLNIDPARLTEELVEVAQWQSDAMEGVAEAQRGRDNAKDYLETVKAEAAAALRYPTDGRKQPSEALIASELLLSPEVHAAMDGLREAEHDLSLWKSVSDSIRTKSSALRVIADLIQSGYTTPNAIYSDRRTKINERRRQLSPET